MPFRRRELLRETGSLAALLGLAGCPSRGGSESSPGDGRSCDDAVVCFEHDHEAVESGLDTLTIAHRSGRNLPADEVYVTGIAFGYPPVRDRGYTYPWHQLIDGSPTAGIADQSVRVHPALVDVVRVLWRRDGEVTLLDEISVSDCESDVACFEHLHQGADDALDRLTIRHVAGRDIPAEDVAITGVATAYPPDPERGRTVPWHELSELDRTTGIAGHSVRVTVGFVDTVSVLWRHDGDQPVLERFRLYE